MISPFTGFFFTYDPFHLTFFSSLDEFEELSLLFEESLELSFFTCFSFFFICFSHDVSSDSSTFGFETGFGFGFYFSDDDSESDESDDPDEDFF